MCQDMEARNLSVRSEICLAEFSRGYLLIAAEGFDEVADVVETAVVGDRRNGGIFVF